VPGIVAAGVLLLAAVAPRVFRGYGFYLIFAVAVTVSVQLVGVYLVFSSLILPALATVKISNRRHASMLAFLVGISGYGIGLVLSALFDLPSGGVIIWVMAFISVWVAIIAHRLSVKTVPEKAVSISGKEQ
jgi:zinc/manganese transport system permease protein